LLAGFPHIGKSSCNLLFKRFSKSVAKNHMQLRHLQSVSLADALLLQHLI